MELYIGNPRKNIRAIEALYPETVQIVVKPGIKDIAQLKGKRVGAPGSGTEGDARAILNILGITFDDLKTEYLDFNGISNRFKDDQIDAEFVVASVPTSALMDLATKKEVSFINFDNVTMDRIIQANPYFVANVIPAGTYKGIDEDIATPAVMAMLITHDDMPVDVIYNFTKGMFENKDIIMHP